MAEVPVDRHWSFLASLKANGEHGNIDPIPDARHPTTQSRPSPKREARRKQSSAGWSARLLESANSTTLPATVTQFLASVFSSVFPPPPPIDEGGGENADLFA